MTTFSASAFWKIPNRFTPWVFAFNRATIVAFWMCSTLMGAQTSLGADYLLRVLTA